MDLTESHPLSHNKSMAVLTCKYLHAVHCLCREKHDPAFERSSEEEDGKQNQEEVKIPFET